VGCGYPHVFLLKKNNKIQHVIQVLHTNTFMGLTPGPRFSVGFFEVVQQEAIYLT
jgi:hypothetical protein